MTKDANGRSGQGSRKVMHRVMLVVLLFGLVSCFGDVVYEGARSANGQYFSLLGVSAAMMGIL